jgi:hypothetical protein
MRIRGPGAGERADRSKALTTRALEGSFLWSFKIPAPHAPMSLPTSASIPASTRIERNRSAVTIATTSR